MFTFFHSESTTEIFGSNGFGNTGFSGITDILAIPKLKFSIKKAQSNGFSGVTDKMAIPTDPVLPKTSVHIHYSISLSLHCLVMESISCIKYVCCEIELIYVSHVLIIRSKHLLCSERSNFDFACIFYYLIVVQKKRDSIHWGSYFRQILVTVYAWKNGWWEIPLEMYVSMCMHPVYER